MSVFQKVWESLPTLRRGQVEEKDQESSSDSDEEDLEQGEKTSGGAEGNADVQLLPRKGEGGIISRQFDASLVLDQAHKKDEEKAKEEEKEEQITGTGIITVLDEGIGKGFIDRIYQFDTAKFCTENHKFAKQTRVEFQAYQSRTAGWQVTAMKVYQSQKKEQRKQMRKNRTEILKVLRINKDSIDVKWDMGELSLSTENKDILPEYPVKPGDWLKVHFEELVNEQAKTSCDETMGKVVSIKFNRTKPVMGKTTKKNDELCVDNEISLTLDVIKNGRQIPLGVEVKGQAVESDQGCFQWRAVEVDKSNIFIHNNEADENEEKEIPTFQTDDMYDNRGGIQIKPDQFIRFEPVTIGSCVTRAVTLKNTSSRSINFVGLRFEIDRAVCKMDCEYPHEGTDVVQTLAPGDTYKITVKCTPLHIGKTKEIGIFGFEDFCILRDFIIFGRSENEELLDKIRKPDDEIFQRPAYQKIRGPEQIGEIMRDSRRTRIRGEAPVRSPFFMNNRILRYPVPDEIREAFQRKDDSIVIRYFPAIGVNLNPENYQMKLHICLWFEELENDLKRRNYDIPGVRLKKVGGKEKQFAFKVPYNVQDVTPPILIHDPIDVWDPDLPGAPKYQGFIESIKDNEVCARFPESFIVAYQGAPMKVSFCLGRSMYKRQHHALEMAWANFGEGFIFPFGFFECAVQTPRIPFFEVDGDSSDDKNDVDNPGPAIVVEKEDTADAVSAVSGLFLKRQKKGYPRQESKYIGDVADSYLATETRRAPSLRAPFVSNVLTSKFLRDVKLKWFNRDLNEEQKNAVRRILRGQARPLPYIIFGPPGTGKTITVVEAIMQVNKLDPNSRILVTAPTNHAADVIAEQLVLSGRYHPGEFVRFNGFIRQGQSPEIIKDHCVNGEFLDSVSMNRLIISTCATAGQFFTLGLTPGHFTHVFIDEAGYCTEPESMIPALNLALNKGGQLILAGDHKQLGPVLMSDAAKSLGLKLSFLERLMNGKTGAPNIYQRRPDVFGEANCGYNPLVVTKLIRNYRAHKTLLKLPSHVFYDDDLISCASEEEAYKLAQNPDIIDNILITPGVPLVFSGVLGQSAREPDSPSWYNADEVMQVIRYVTKLRSCGVKNENIGIISPYRKQCEKLRIALELQLDQTDIPKVGSVEEFQGGERDVIIISTVRSLGEEKIRQDMDKLGFIYDEKRFNVAITRAKSLMILVGNPHVLWLDKNWNLLIKFCVELKAYTGCSLPHALDEGVKKLYSKVKQEDTKLQIPGLPPDMATGNYNPNGWEDQDDED